MLAVGLSTACWEHFPNHLTHSRGKPRRHVPRITHLSYQDLGYQNHGYQNWAMLRHCCNWAGLIFLVLLASSVSVARNEPTVEELKARISSAKVSDKAKICVEIAQKQLDEADKQYAAGDIEKAASSLSDVVAYSELARDYSIQSHKHQKQIEIATRTMTRKLNDILHALSREDQAPVKDALTRLERVRDDLLAAMFPKGAK